MILELAKKYGDFFYAVGFFSEIIMFALVIGLIYTNYLDTILFIVVFFLNILLNRFLKSTIKDPRPEDVKKFLYSEYISKKHVAYGMPSGHSQNVFYSIVYLYLSNPNYQWLYLTMTIGILTLYERWKFHNHTINQLIVGMILGSSIAYLVVHFREYLREYIDKNINK